MFKGLAGDARSILLYGENGSGKSSVVDGIEFALRGVVSRRAEDGKKDRREIRQMFPKRRDPIAALVFDDGTAMVRGAAIAEPDQRKYVGRDVVPGFEKSPVVIRRRDIDGFWTTAAEVRQSVFFDYLRPVGGEFLDQNKRNQAAERYEQAVRKHEDALDILKQMLPDWNHWPERKKAIAPMRRRLRVSTEKQRERQADLDSAITTFEKALEERNIAVPAGKQAADIEDLDRTISREVFRLVGARVADDFFTVTGKTLARTVKFDVSDNDSISISLVTANGVILDPTQVLSEAMLDLLALLIFVEVHIECAERGQERLLILDDVFQSVDRSLRMRTLEHLAARLEGWQLILTLHDRLWLELADRALTAAGHNHLNVEIRRSRIDDSPFIVEPLVGPMSDLSWALDHNASPTLIASAAGRALEACLDEATQYLGTPVRRNVGDRFTINMLWEPLYADLKKCTSEDLQKVAESIQSNRFLRNIVGAHYSDHAQGISGEEMLDFADSVLQFRRHLSCPVCGSHYKRGGKVEGKWALEASCKHKQVAPDKKEPLDS